MLSSKVENLNLTWPESLPVTGASAGGGNSLPTVNPGSIPRNLVLFRTDLSTHLHKSLARNTGIEVSLAGIHGASTCAPGRLLRARPTLAAGRITMKAAAVRRSTSPAAARGEAWWRVESWSSSVADPGFSWSRSEHHNE